MMKKLGLRNAMPREPVASVVLTGAHDLRRSRFTGHTSRAY